MNLNNVTSIVVGTLVFVICSCLSSVRGQERFLEQIRTINEEVEKWYNTESHSVKNVNESSDHTSEAYLQSKDKHWPRQMMRVLQVATDLPSSSEVDMTKVARISSGLYNKDPKIVGEFHWNINRFLRLEKRKYDEKDVKIYAKYIYYGQMKSLCTPYSLHSKEYFNFQKAINELLEFAKVEKLSDEQFSELVLNTSQPITPLYSAAWICQVLIASVIDTPHREWFEYSESTKDAITVWPYPTKNYEIFMRSSADSGLDEKKWVPSIQL